MKKRSTRKLNLTRETLSFLQDLKAVGGASYQTYTHLTFCPGCHTHEAGCTQDICI